MPRRARLILEGAYYHVIIRGNQKQNVFRDVADYNTYLRIIKRYKNKYKFKLYGWCLMTNHIHMVIKSDLLPKVMHGINLSYAQYFSYKYKNTGHFWQDRYKSHLFQKDEYLINCISYIEYNPIRAKMVLKPEDYKWSSYRSRILGEKNNITDSLPL